MDGNVRAAGTLPDSQRVRCDPPGAAPCGTATALDAPRPGNAQLAVLDVLDPPNGGEPGRKGGSWQAHYASMNSRPGLATLVGRYTCFLAFACQGEGIASDELLNFLRHEHGTLCPVYSA